MKLIFVHGINNEDKNAQIIADDWIEALQKGCEIHGFNFPASVEVKAAYYGDLLADATETWGQTTEATTAMSATQPDANSVTVEHAAFYQAFQRKMNLSDADLAQFMNGEDELAPMAAGIHKRWLKAIARALENVLPTKGRYVARMFLKQAAAYLHAPEVKKQVDQLVQEQVFNDIGNHDKIAIVSHSLGTIVSYDLLRKMHGSDTNVDLFLTAGSPLGIEIVKTKLGVPRFMPNSIKRWVNASDPEDFVALESELNSETFGPVTVKNYVDLDNGHDDAHDIREYLKHKSVVEEIVKTFNSA